MKKNSSIIFLIVSVAMVFLACNKTSITNKDSLEKFYDYSNEYMSNNKQLFSDDGESPGRVRKWRTFLKVAGEDLKGAASGAAAGGAVGGAVGGPGGALVGAGIGGAITGAGASMAAYADIKDKNEKQSSDFSPIINLNNPYDNIGEVHYIIVNELIENDLGNSFENFDNQQYYFQTINLLANNEFWTLEELDVYEYNIYFSTFSSIKSSYQNNEMASDYIKNLDHLTQKVRDVLYVYIKAFESSTSTSSFINYSINVEDLILNSTELDSLDKMQVLSVMSTARLGIQYWCQEFDEN